jgi:flavodoxin
MKTLVIYYSRTGITKKIGQAIASKIQADTEEIIDLKDRKGAWEYLKAGRDAMKRVPADIADTKNDPAGYDLVVIGTPVWAGNMACAIRTYIGRNKDRIKKLALFCTMGGAGDQNTFNEMESLSGKTVAAKITVRTREAGKPETDARLDEFVRQLSQ